MGGKQSHDIDKQRIKDITNSVSNQFFKDFKVWYKEIINEKVKSQNIWREGKLQLLLAPVPHRPLKRGYICKLGHNVKSWKRRYLVALNRRDNYLLRYYDDASLSRCRGSIDCCGYSVKTFLAEEDQNNYGIYGIQLVPNEENSRVWFFRVATAKEQDEWIQIFLNACKKTSPDPNRDIYYVAAFQRAFKATKASYGYYGLCEPVTSEVELLSQLSKRILRREVIDEYIQTFHQHARQTVSSLKRSSSRSGSQKIGGGEAEIHSPAQTPLSFVATSSTRQDSIIVISEVNDIVNSVVSPIILNTYKRTLVYVAETTSEYEESVRAALPTLLQAEKNIYDFILKRLKSLIDPNLNDLQHRIFEPIMETMFEKLMEKTHQCGSYIDTLKGIEKLDNIIDTIDDSEKNCLLESYDILWKLMTKELIDIADIFEGCDIQPFSVIYINSTEEMRQLIHNALYTLKCLLKGDYEDEKKLQHEKYGYYTFWLRSLLASSTSPAGVKDALPSSSEVRSPATSKKSEESQPNLNASGKSSKSVDQRPSSAEISLKLDILYSYMEHDLFEIMISRFVEILSDMVEITIQEAVLIPGQEIFNSAQSIERETSFLVHLNCLGERIVRDCVKSYLHHFLTSHVDSYGEKIKRRLQECRLNLPVSTASITIPHSPAIMPDVDFPQPPNEQAPELATVQSQGILTEQVNR